MHPTFIFVEVPALWLAAGRLNQPIKHTQTEGNTKQTPEAAGPGSEWGPSFVRALRASARPSSTPARPAWLPHTTRPTQGSPISGADDLVHTALAGSGGSSSNGGRQHGDAGPPHPRHHPPAARRLPQARHQGSSTIVCLVARRTS